MNYTIYKQRTYLDPIHGPIQLNIADELENLLVKLIDTRELQRLRRIRQMGTGWFTFHGAEHTRFGHSLGALFIASKMINHLSMEHLKVAEFTPQILASALLHDIGHGPLSHTSEKLVPFSHEEWTKKIVLGDTEIHSLLESYDKDLPENIVKTLEYKGVPLYVSQIVSSYIDCDRLDYLHRDSYFVGVPYGLTGSQRIIASLDIDDNSKKLVVSESIGLDVIIHYLHARYSMYQQIYQHKKNLASDFLIRKIIERAKTNKPSVIDDALWKWIRSNKIEDLDVELYTQVDDYVLISAIQKFAYKEKDPLLKDLSTRFVTRSLFKSLEFRAGVEDGKVKEILERLKQAAIVKGLDASYYFGLEKSSSKPYEPYEVNGNDKNNKAIYVKQKNGKVIELSQISGLVKALSEENVVKICLVFAPELEDAIKDIKGFQELFK